MTPFLIARPLFSEPSVEVVVRSFVDRWNADPAWVATVIVAATSILSWCGGSTRGRVASVAAILSVALTRFLVAFAVRLGDVLFRPGHPAVLQTLVAGGGNFRTDVSVALLVASALVMTLHRQFVASSVLLWLLCAAAAAGRGAAPADGHLAGVLAGAFAAAVIASRPGSSFAKRATFALTIFEHSVVGIAARMRHPGHRTGRE